MSRRSVIVVSNMLTGAGSVAVSARPAFPITLWTSGNCISSRSVCCRSSRPFVMLIPGSVLGIYKRSPSSSGGMNSVPRRVKGMMMLVIANTAPSSTTHRNRIAIVNSGWYIHCWIFEIGLTFSWMIFCGTSSIPMRMAHPSANQCRYSPYRARGMTRMSHAGRSIAASVSSRFFHHPHLLGSTRAVMKRLISTGMIVIARNDDAPIAKVLV